MFLFTAGTTTLAERNYPSADRLTPAAESELAALWRQPWPTQYGDLQQRLLYNLGTLYANRLRPDLLCELFCAILCLFPNQRDEQRQIWLRLLADGAPDHAVACLRRAIGGATDRTVAIAVVRCLLVLSRSHGFQQTAYAGGVLHFFDTRFSVPGSEQDQFVRGIFRAHSEILAPVRNCARNFLRRETSALNPKEWLAVCVQVAERGFPRFAEKTIGTLKIVPLMLPDRELQLARTELWRIRRIRKPEQEGKQLEEGGIKLLRAASAVAAQMVPDAMEKIIESALTEVITNSALRGQEPDVDVTEDTSDRT